MASLVPFAHDVHGVVRLLDTVRYLLKIKNSLDLRQRSNGSNGYFKFIEGFTGQRIKDNKVNYSVVVL